MTTLQDETRDAPPPGLTPLLSPARLPLCPLCLSRAHVAWCLCFALPCLTAVPLIDCNCRPDCCCCCRGLTTHIHTYLSCASCVSCLRAVHAHRPPAAHPTGLEHVVGWRCACLGVGRDRREQKHPCMAPRPVLAALTSLGQQGAGAESKRALAEPRPGGQRRPPS
jgi:hypothetical protein